MAKRADGYQATNGFVYDPALTDVDDATGYEREIAGPGSVEITLLVDLCEAKSVKYANVHVRYNHTLDVLVEHSEDGIVWGTSGGSAPNLIVNGCNYNLRYWTFTYTNLQTYRYWRFSLRDNNPGLCDSAKIGAFEVWLSDSLNRPYTEPADCNAGAGATPTMADACVSKNVEGIHFYRAFLTATNLLPHDVTFGVVQNFNVNLDEEVVELDGPESQTPVGVGQGGKSITTSWSHAEEDPYQLAMVLGAEVDTLALISDPASAPTLAAAAGSTTFTAGYIAVAYAYVNRFGMTKRSPIQTVQVTAGQQINVTALGSVPSGATVNWFMSEKSYATAAEAAAAALRLIANNAGGAFSLTAYPNKYATPSPKKSEIGAGTIIRHSESDCSKFFDCRVRSAQYEAEQITVLYNCRLIRKASSVGAPRSWKLEDYQLNCYGRKNVDEEDTDKIVYFETFYRE